MKVHNLNTADMQSHHTIHGGHVSVGIPLSSIGIQIQVKTKNFISNYGNSLKNQKVNELWPEKQLQNKVPDRKDCNYNLYRNTFNF